MTLMSKLSKPPTLKPFKLALIQLGNISSNKNDNIKHAREMIMKAASAKPDLIVLPASIYLLANECFNSPYGHVHFPVYAEKIGFTPGEPYDIGKSESESVKMLSSAAKECNIWLIGGRLALSLGTGIHYLDFQAQFLNEMPALIMCLTPARCIIHKVNGSVVFPNDLKDVDDKRGISGELIAYHRKVHLFDIDIPGKIKFKESETLTGGTTLNFFDTDPVVFNEARGGIPVTKQRRFDVYPDVSVGK
ncbi:hypothetical protein HHX47_DHR1000470 [Lentinula edodes]|nr:hypothetical protein HHX47_DHR1000470 [Lentinula edodes]